MQSKNFNKLLENLKYRLRDEDDIDDEIMTHLKDIRKLKEELQNGGHAPFEDNSN